MADWGRVLVVDDEPRIVELVERCLSAEGYTVDAAPNRVIGLPKALAHEYSLALIDLVLADGDGIDVVRGIREQKPDLPVVVISASGDRALIEECVQLGATFLAKPFTLGELLAVVRTRAAALSPTADCADRGIRDA